MAVVKISKSYGRKVSLKEFTNRFENIDCGTILTLPLNVETEDDLNKALRVMGKKVLKDTEREIAEAISNLKDLMEDPDNDALIGEGTSVSKASRKSTTIDGMNDILKKSGLTEENLDVE